MSVVMKGFVRSGHLISVDSVWCNPRSLDASP